MYVLAGMYLATRPAFVVFVAVQVLIGYGTGVFESVLNAYIAALPEPTTLLNRLHAFFGVGALLGPLLATWMLRFTAWPWCGWCWPLACVPLLAGFLVAYPRAPPPGGDRSGLGRRRAARHVCWRPRCGSPGCSWRGCSPSMSVSSSASATGASAISSPPAGVPDLIAGYTISGYWLGLTLGRFLISPVAARFGLGAAGHDVRSAWPASSPRPP